MVSEGDPGQQVGSATVLCKVSQVLVSFKHLADPVKDSWKKVPCCIVLHRL